MFYRISHTTALQREQKKPKRHLQKAKGVRSPGIEPGSITWQATIITTRPRARYLSNLKMSLPRILTNKQRKHGDTTVWVDRIDQKDSTTTSKKKLQARGFEPLPLTRMAPKATALTTRPNLRPCIIQTQKKYSKRGSNS